MSGTYIWGDMGRTTSDPTTVDEAISEAIDAHLADPDAHLDATGSLQSHRASEIIDHLAESVVNDKLHSTARSFVANVGTGVDGDYDTIQAAVDFASTVGGGTIYLAPGDHYITGVCDLPMNINFYAADYESCTVHANYTGGNYIYVTASTPDEQKLMTFENITFSDDGGGIFNFDAADFLDLYTMEFTNCHFIGGGKYIVSREMNVRLNRCYVICTAGPAFKMTYQLTLQECYIEADGSTNNTVLVEFDENDYTACAVWAYDTDFVFGAVTAAPIFSTAWEHSINLFSCNLYNWDYQNSALFTFNMQNCFVSGRTNRIYTIRDDGNEGTIAFNTILATGSGYILPSANTVKFVGNYMTGAASHASQDITLREDMAINAWNIASNSATAMSFDGYRTVQLTPNSTRTLTSAVPRAGEIRQLIVLTSGTTSYTLTFGTGFKTTGTLATGVTSARRFVINFVSDGTYLIETSRTVAIA